MDFLPASLREFLTADRLTTMIQAFLLIVGGIILARLVSSGAGRLLKDRLSVQGTMILRRFLYYGFLALVFASALNQLGFKLTVLLGAAGILTVALGFASQTAASNLISGLFVIAERPFEVGDVVKVADVTGEVLSIDLLSIKVRTFDNLYVRIPNEEVIKSRITTLTRFPIRRFDLQLGVAYKEDLEKVKAILFEVADRNPVCLDEPKPLYVFQRFGDSAQEFQFSVWGRTESYLELRNSISVDIKKALDEAGVEIPFPHRTIYAGSVTDPIPVRMVEERGE